ncbi:hypothetical protein RJT34_32895 [Clitoria ternatea]|uniref:Uncharacterized protein n=1 Tax=Clitoria ternatea TaxID=43366 RepID=A0AAN9EWU3_CLITE
MDNFFMCDVLGKRHSDIQAPGPSLLGNCGPACDVNLTHYNGPLSDKVVGCLNEQGVNCERVCCVNDESPNGPMIAIGLLSQAVNNQEESHAQGKQNQLLGEHVTTFDGMIQVGGVHHIMLKTVNHQRVASLNNVAHRENSSESPGQEGGAQRDVVVAMDLSKSMNLEKVLHSCGLLSHKSEIMFKVPHDEHACNIHEQLVQDS